MSWGVYRCQLYVYHLECAIAKKLLDFADSLRTTTRSSSQGRAGNLAYDDFTLIPGCCEKAVHTIHDNRGKKGRREKKKKVSCHHSVVKWFIRTPFPFSVAESWESRFQGRIHWPRRSTVVLHQCPVQSPLDENCQLAQNNPKSTWIPHWHHNQQSHRHRNTNMGAGRLRTPVPPGR